ncbi:hypothetical protein ACFLZX_04615 [Nanoarchaeota archaeon]
MKAKKILRNWRVIILLVFVLLSIVSLNPRPMREGVAIRSVQLDSAAADSGMESPLGTTRPIDREYIIKVNNQPVTSVDEFYDAMGPLEVNKSVLIETNLRTYRPIVKEDFEIIELNETEIINITEEIYVNETINDTVVLVPKNVTTQKEVPKIEKIPLGPQGIGIKLYDLPKTNLKKGLDLEGGTRVLLKPEENITSEQFDLLLEVLEQRLDVYKLTDMVIRGVSDLEQNRFVLIEIAGASESEVRNLLGSQGKFEAQIANESVFFGDQIDYICRDPTCAGLDPQRRCSNNGQTWSCPYRFEITVDEEAAQNHKRITAGLEVVQMDGGNDVLSEKIDFLLDDVLVRSLFIDSDLKDSEQRTTSITGFGEGHSEQAAAYNALNDMKQLQTILSTGILPVKLEVSSINTISPILGVEFLNNAILVGVFALLTVGIVIYLRYRRFAISIPIMVTMLCELTILLGAASLINWNISLAAIAGIILVVGTGVDHQIVITDETMSGKSASVYNWKDKIKNAFAIIMGAYFTNVVALIPLIYAGAGLVQGFALTTILGYSIGVFITRPAFAAVVEILLKE